MREILCIILVVFNLSCYAQWVGSYSGNVFADVAFASGGHGVAVGFDIGVQRPSIAVTSNGGASWTANTLSSGYDLNSVSIASGSIMYTCGTGEIYKSVNGGISWAAINQPDTITDSVYFYTQFIDPLNGFVVDESSNIFKTTDGGNTWSFFKNGGYFGLEQWGFGAADVDHVLLGDNGGIYRTTNGGVSWDTTTAAQLGLATGEKIYWVYCNDIGKAFFATSTSNANAKVYMSTDFGNTWTLIFSNAKLFHDLKQYGTNEIAIVVDKMDLYYSTDGGNSFGYVTGSDFNGGAIKRMAFSSSDNLVGVGNESLAFGIFNFNNVTTGVADLHLKNDIEVYPNPAHNNLSIENNSGKEQTIKIFDATGQLIFETKTISNTTLDISNYSSGIYFVDVSTDLQKVYKKIVKI